MAEWFKEYFGLQYIIGDNTKAFGFNSLEDRVEYEVNQIIELGEVRWYENFRCSL